MHVFKKNETKKHIHVTSQVPWNGKIVLILFKKIIIIFEKAFSSDKKIRNALNTQKRLDFDVKILRHDFFFNKHAVYIMRYKNN